jgi:hypothetical protein
MTTAPTLTPVPGATPRYDDDGNEIVNVATCGTCGRSWNDAAISSWTPAPSARCPFEYDHEDDDAPESQTQYVVAYGNVADGFSFVGPFNNANDAGDYAGESDDREWWVVKLDPPPAEWLTDAA